MRRAMMMDDGFGFVRSEQTTAVTSMKSLPLQVTNDDDEAKKQRSEDAREPISRPVDDEGN